MLEFLIKKFVTGYELSFLEQFANDEEKNFEFKDNFRDKQHLRRLRDLNFIENIKPKSIGDLNYGENLKGFFKITEPGKTYLKFIK